MNPTMLKDINEINQKIKELEDRRMALHKEIEPLQNKVVKIHGELQELYDQRSGMLPFSWERAINYAKANEGVEFLRLMEKNLRETFDMWHSGYWSDTEEACLKVCIKRNSEESIRKNRDGVVFFSTKLTPHDDGLVWFGIFESTLSEYGSYSLKVNPQGLTSTIIKTTYGRESVVGDFATLDAALDFISRKLYY